MAEYEGMKLEETRRSIIATFTDCGCRFTFDKWNVAVNHMTIEILYCKTYPKCGKVCASVFEQARKRLLKEAYEAQLVIPDEDADEMMGMNWTGMI